MVYYGNIIYTSHKGVFKLKTIHTHNKTHPKYAFVPVLSITALVKEFSPVESVILPVRVKVAKFHGPDSIVAPNFCI